MLAGIFWLMHSRTHNHAELSFLIRAPTHKAVFLITQCRSGSSVVGELFRQQPGVFYLYEPLYPFREADVVRAAESQVLGTVEAVEAMARCQIGKLPALYERAFEQTKQPDRNQCLSNGLCFLTASSVPKTPNFSRSCSESDFLAAKINYLRSIRDVAHMISLSGNENGFDTRIVHLYRDPRATTRSLLSTPHQPESKIRKVARRVCERLVENRRFIRQHKMNDNWRFYEMRFEDFASDPLGFTGRLYDFIDARPAPELLHWVKDNTASKNGKGSGRYGTRRDASRINDAWRSWYRFDELEAIQEECGEALTMYNYTVFTSPEHLTNLSISSYPFVP